MFHCFGIGGLRWNQSVRLVEEYRSHLARRAHCGETVRPATHLVYFIGECDVFDRHRNRICLVTPERHAQRVVDRANWVATALGAEQLASAPMHPRCQYSGYDQDDEFNTFARSYNLELRHLLKDGGVGRVILLKTTKAVPEANSGRRFVPRPEMYDQSDFERFGFGIHFLPGTKVHDQIFLRSIQRTWPHMFE